jgi:hypothetical protein
MEKRTGEFAAHTEDGREYTIFVFTNFIDAGTRDDPNAVVEGLKRLVTSDGDDVNRLEKGKYKVVSGGIELSSDDPDAP